MMQAAFRIRWPGGAAILLFGVAKLGAHPSFVDRSLERVKNFDPRTTEVRPFEVSEYQLPTQPAGMPLWPRA